MTKTQQGDWFWCSVCSGYHTVWFAWSGACSEINSLAFETIVLEMPHAALHENHQVDQHDCMGWYCNCKSTEKVRAELAKVKND